MRTAVDTNILSALLSEEPLAPQISLHLARCKQAGPLIISPVVYAELFGHPNATQAALDYFLSRTGIDLDNRLDHALWTEAGIRYARHAARRRMTAPQGPRRILADFIIGAHALHRADRLLTMDTTLFQRDFPDLQLYEAHLA